MDILKMSEEHVEECTDLYIDAFTKSPWHDAYDSRAQVVSFFQNHMANNYFLGYVLKGQTGIAALCIGMKKPWIQGTEYYIDQFCVKPALQGGRDRERFFEIDRSRNAQGRDKCDHFKYRKRFSV